MFPFRRGGKKRGKPQGGSGGGGGRRQSGGGRRIPGSAAELLGTLQPTTKSLAQVLAGNTRASGQVVHARNILSQAERLVDERAVDRLPPKQREEFLEQLARLKLTLADADVEADVEAAAAEAEPAPVQPAMSMDRLRELALSLATGSAAPGGETKPTDSAADAAVDQSADGPEDGPADAPMATGSDEADAEEGEPSEAARKARVGTTSRPARAKRGDTLRLKSARHEPADDDTERHAEAAR